MIAGMDANPDHPASEQACTTFRVPGRLLELALVLVLAASVLHTVWDAVTATGSFTEAPGPVRAAVVAGISYLAIRCARPGLHHLRKYGRRGRFGPDIERIESS